MGSITFTSQFPTVPLVGSAFQGLNNVNLFDYVTAAVNPWTVGSTMITPISAGAAPPLLASWTIQGWGISFSGLLWHTSVPAQTSMVTAATTNAVGPSTGLMGKLGQLWGGILPTQQGQTYFSGSARQPSNVPAVPYVPYGQSPLPANSGSIELLWDGATDDFPVLGLSNQTDIAPQTVTFSQSLNQPIPLQSGEQVCMGLWLTPSLVIGCGLSFGVYCPIIISNAQYSITLDDGQPDVQGWGGG